MSLQQEQRERAGCVQLRRSRAAGVVVGVYRAADAGLDPDGGAWVTVCEEHHTIVNHDTRMLALSWAPRPDEWCDGCRDVVSADAEHDRWHNEPVDRSGTMAFVHLIRSPDDAERTPRPKGGRKDRAPHLMMRRKSPAAIDEWTEAIRAKLSDGKPRTFNSLCVEIGDLTADVAFQEAPDIALWALVCDGELEHTVEAPILFRLKPKGIP